MSTPDKSYEVQFQAEVILAIDYIQRAQPAQLQQREQRELTRKQNLEKELQEERERIKRLTYEREELSNRLREIDYDVRHRIDIVQNLSEELARLGQSSGYSSSPPISVDHSLIKDVEKEAENIIHKRSLRQYLCPALLSVSNDANEVAKVIVPVLIPLILAGTIVTPLNPVLFGWLAIIIAKMGVSSFCADNKTTT